MLADLRFFVIDDFGFFFWVYGDFSVVMFLLSLRCFLLVLVLVALGFECHVTNCRAGKPRGLSGQYFNVLHLCRLPAVRIPSLI